MWSVDSRNFEELGDGITISDNEMIASEFVPSHADFPSQTYESHGQTSPRGRSRYSLNYRYGTVNSTQWDSDQDKENNTYNSGKQHANDTERRGRPLRRMQFA